MILKDWQRRVVFCILWSAMAVAGLPFAHAQSSSPGSSPGATPETEGMKPDPQIVIWSDDLTNVLGATAYNATHDEFMVGWTTWQDQWSRDIWARRLTPDGSLLEHFNVAAIAGDLLESPAISYCPLHEEFLIGYTNWYDGSGDFADVQARRVAWNGGWMSDIFTVSPAIAAHSQPSIAYSPSDDEYVVAYTNSWGGGNIDLYAQRIRATDGSLLSLSGVASGAGWQYTYSRVAFHPAAYAGEGGYLIGYYAYSPSPIAGRVRYKMTRTDLSDLWVNPEVDAGSTTVALPNPQLGVGDAGFLIAWWEANAGGYQVKARRISFDGVALGPAEGIPVSGTYAYGPTVYGLAVAYAFRQRYLVLWEHLSPSGSLDIHGTFVSEESDTTIGGEFALGNGVDHIVNPAASCSPMSKCLVAYEWSNPPSMDIAGQILDLLTVFFSDGFESGDTSAWSSTVP